MSLPLSSFRSSCKLILMSHLRCFIVILNTKLIKLLNKNSLRDSFTLLVTCDLTFKTFNFLSRNKKLLTQLLQLPRNFQNKSHKHIPPLFYFVQTSLSFASLDPTEKFCLPSFKVHFLPSTCNSFFVCSEFLEL